MIVSEPAALDRATHPVTVPFERKLSLKRYSPPGVIRPRKRVYPPLPEGRLSHTTVAVVVRSVSSIPGSRAAAIAPALESVRRPAPGTTAAAPAVVTHG